MCYIQNLMFRSPLHFLLFIGLLTFATNRASADKPRTAMENYRLHCAACHGDKLDGGVGGSFINGNWRYGGSPEEIFRNIKYGNPDVGMEPFGDTLSDADIRALVVYIREEEEKERLRKLALPKAAPGKVISTDHHSYYMETVAEGLDIPWGLEFMPDRRYLVTERSGNLRLYRKGWHRGKTGPRRSRLGAPRPGRHAGSNVAPRLRGKRLDLFGLYRWPGRTTTGGVDKSRARTHPRQHMGG